MGRVSGLEVNRPLHLNPWHWWGLIRRWRRALGLCLLSVVCWMLVAGHWLVVPSNPAPADAVVVLGGATNRTVYGIELIGAGLAPELWHTGWTNLHTQGSKRDDLAVLHNGPHPLPEEAIFLLETTSTWEDGREVARLARQRGVRHLLIITDWHHSRRALCVVRHHLAGSAIHISFASALPAPDHLNWWWQHDHTRHLVVSEWQKLLFYGVRYGLPLWMC